MSHFLSAKLAMPLCAALACAAAPASAVPLLGSDLASFAVLGASTVTNVPTSTVVGNVGVSPGSSITGFLSSPGVAVADPQVTSGSVHATTAVAASAQGQLTTARTNLGLLGAGTLLPADLVGLTLMPGVYTVPAGVTNLSGAVTLDGGGNANAAWVFQVTSALITSSGSTVNVIGTGAGAGIYWNVGSSATLGTSSSFEGNILALTSISLTTGSTIGCGRALAETAAVTMDMNTIGIGCASNGYNGGIDVVTTSGGETQVVFLESASIPEPGTLTLFAFGGLAALGFTWRRQAA